MTSQRLLKLLCLISMIATASAVYVWRQTGDPPSPWLIRLAIAMLAAALVVFVIDRETRPRFMLQFLAALFAAVALFAITGDLTAAHSGTGGFHGATILERMDEFVPSLHTSLKAWTTRTLGGTAWDPVLTGLLGLPAYMVFAVLALICGYAGRPRREVHIFIN